MKFSTNPYSDAGDVQFWSRAMSTPPPGQIDPVTNATSIGRDQRVATLGSCFAQHIARHLAKSGCTYYIAENAPPGLSAEMAVARNYGVFSARYGNVYTVRQAVQLFDRAFGSFQPVESEWVRGDVLVDPFRPQIEPDGFASSLELAAAREVHFDAVRCIFKSAQWLVFTLGLTEAWMDRRDGAVFPLAPGVAGGRFDPQRHEFRNFTASEVKADLFDFIRRLRSVNPHCGVILTVSPVPLIATYEKRHVWVSTTYSKSALRVAADEAERELENVIYFPSYEIITSPAAGGNYYADDLRQVTDVGVRHVMRVFSKHFIQGSAFCTAPPIAPSINLTASSHSDIVCDEETIQHAMNQSGTTP